ncbi:vegetative cell wall protein gp1-like [Diospyros lotus]|uniref:vegetative cell wall protein gp1-like n=1 Tax=Diospyros lotus TaxID=55363 RepID=UPI0022519B0D|nr:vegetative cell wall protein gp1-like [Diospyros lotus]
MARPYGVLLIVLLAILSVELAVSADPPQTAPSPAPEIGGDSLSPPPEAGSPASPSPSQGFSSPPAPPPSDLAPGSSGTPLPASSPSKDSPSPAPSAPSDVNVEKGDVTAESKGNESSSGMKGGQKAGIVVGLIAGACLVGFGVVVYKKRQQNIRRAQFGEAARRVLL